MIIIFNERSEVIYLKSIYKLQFLWLWMNLYGFLAQTNLQTERQANFTLSHGNPFNKKYHNENQTLSTIKMIEIGALIKK